MKYISTRGNSPEVGFRNATLGGLAPDGGLYMPLTWPAIDSAANGLGYTDMAEAVLAPFVGDALDDATLRAVIDRAYSSFETDQTGEIIPVRSLGNGLHLMELFHGPTFAFKDVAMQFIGALFDELVSQAGAPVTVLGATSGDTGAAAVHAFAGKAGVRIVMLHPKGRISDVQRRQMTTRLDDNVFNVAVDGDFDDCQAMVKTVMADHAFKARYSLTTVNSINWARIAAQAVYYAYWSNKLAGEAGRVDFVVPSGNFGNAFSAYVARQMGCPVGRVTIATNTNDVLVRTLLQGTYKPGKATPTSSPAMDISSASNYERLLYELSGRDAGLVRDRLEDLKDRGAYDLDKDTQAGMAALYDVASASEQDTRDMIAFANSNWDLTIDPHTAVGLHAAKGLGGRDVPVISLSTAHPAKFPDTVASVLGNTPEMPQGLKAVLDKDERQVKLSADANVLKEFMTEQLSS